MSIQPEEKSMEAIVSLAKRRGFVYPASEIYGGINGFWDYGPLGIALKNNIRDWWWHRTVDCPPIGPDGQPLSIVGLDSSIIQNPAVWVASGHVGGFNDPMVDCTETKKRYRQDQLEVLEVDKGDRILRLAFPENQRDAIKKKLKKNGVGLDDGQVKNLTEYDVSEYPTIVGPDTTKAGTLTEPRQFNLMFETYVGAIRDENAKTYLRPETAQGIFLNYKNVLDTTRVKVPFGIAQIGKSFRNEVTPRNFIFRSREFEQMELEWFCSPEDSATWYEFWKQERMRWWLSLGISESNLRFRDHDEDELAHYSRACVDVEYKYPFTAPKYGELEGVAHRGDYDLGQHQSHSKTRLEYFDQAVQMAAKEAGLDANTVKERSRYLPHVIEPASGLTRGVLVLLCEAFTPDESRASKVYMNFAPRFAPVKAGIFPLVNKEEMTTPAHKLFLALRENHVVEYDAKQTIGKRYARMDEVGTPLCFTLDGETAATQTVTVRHRNTQAQERIALDQVERYLSNTLKG